MNAVRMNTADLARRFKITRQAMTEQLARPDAPQRKDREAWQTRAEAEAAAQETAEIIQGDLYGTVPLALAGKLSGRVFTPAEVRQIVRAEIDATVRQWVKGERVSAEAIPKK